MNCQKQGCTGTLKITHSFSAPGGRTQRAECVKCHTVHTIQAIVAHVDPGYGQGAAALARRMKKAAKE